MKELDQLVEGIEKKINTLLSTLDHLKAENVKLKQTEKELISLIEHQKQTIEQIQENINPITISKSIVEPDITEIRKRISGLVQDIDKCIGLLNK
jgi:soluble cytochrome b562